MPSPSAKPSNSPWGPLSHPSLSLFILLIIRLLRAKVSIVIIFCAQSADRKRQCLAAVFVRRFRLLVRPVVRLF